MYYVRQSIVFLLYIFVSHVTCETLESALYKALNDVGIDLAHSLTLVDPPTSEREL